jgi:hypothetical protein
MTKRVGTRQDARTALVIHTLGGLDRDIDFEVVGSGEDRTAYLIAGTVYKVGRRASANRYDHATLTAAREAGMAWAPVTTLYDFELYGDPIPVLAMPYLPDDGTEPDPALVAEMHAQTGGQVDRIGGNWVSRQGRPVVLDGCTVEDGAWV